MKFYVEMSGKQKKAGRRSRSKTLIDQWMKRHSNDSTVVIQKVIVPHNYVHL